MSALEEDASACKRNFILRFSPPQFPSVRSPSLQGFIVQATLKDTEYTVIDDRVFKTRLFPDCGYGDDTCNQTSSDNTSYSWLETREKPTYNGLQALQYIQHKAGSKFENALSTLQLFVEDGCFVTRSAEFTDAHYVDETVEKRLIKTVSKFRKDAGAMDYFFINGHAFDVHTLKKGTAQLFSCLSAISSSSAHMRTLAAEYGLSTVPRLDNLPVSNSMRRLRVQIDFDNLVPSSFLWVNDILNDSRYKKWGTLDPNNEEDVSSFVKQVQKNKESEKVSGLDYLLLVKTKSHHLSLQLVLDPGDPEQFAYLSVPESIVLADLPIHVGVALVPNGRVSSLIVASFHYFLRLKGRKTAVKFITMIRKIMEYFGAGFRHVPLSRDIVETAFEQISSRYPGDYDSAEAVLEGDEDVAKKLEESKKFAEEMKLFTDAEGDVREGGDARKLSFLCLLNGIVLKDIASDILPVGIAEQQRIANMIQSKHNPDLPSDAGTFEQYIMPDPNLIVVKNLAQDMKTDDTKGLRKVNELGLPNVPAKALFAVRNEIRNIDYINDVGGSKAKDDFKVTVWLSGADHSSEAFGHAKSLVTELASSPFASKTKSRFAVIEVESKLNKEILRCSPDSDCVETVVFVINGKRIASSSVRTMDGLTVEVGSAFETENVPESIRGELRLFYHIYAKEVGVPCTSPTAGQEEGIPVTYEHMKDAISSKGMSELVYPRSANIANGKEPLTILAVLDPLSPYAFIFVSLLNALEGAYAPDDIGMKLVLAPKVQNLNKHHDQPSTYNKFLLQPDTHSSDALELAPPRAIFNRLPQSKVLTISVEPPRAWFMSSYATNYDMDNIVLNSLPENTQKLYAEYELRNLIVEGSCIDETDKPPQGLKLILENEGKVSVDTIVMANLGYFQLKVPTPGQWNLHLAPGPSSQVYSLKMMEMAKERVKTVYNADSRGRILIHVDSLTGAGGIVLRVVRNPGMKGRSVLNPDDGDTKVSKAGVIEKIRSTFESIYPLMNNGENKPNNMQSQRSLSNPETIHVFSVASGHLYERFLKIMISSVTKHASRPVKFWLLDNYLSPSFRKVIPHFAKKHGAEVGMVTYRWPGWLRAQTEKQRIIWAYKILFLDVLFPLDVGRIIFVDSDQVVRGDLAELMDIDLEGAPYGYVPFCDSRKEAEGYRFWKTGFWKDTLRGEKYRISALYVVDLNRFRETSSGDTLRLIYQTLSADPNSLSNLDQDLPNYASVKTSIGSSVPIFNLPQEWLWCESWCDDESKKEAKAIDLCNNPDTKEHKLDSAMRIIPEWVDYDDAASKLTEELYMQILSSDEKENMSTDAKCSKNEGSTNSSGAKEEL